MTTASEREIKCLVKELDGADVGDEGRTHRDQPDQLAAGADARSRGSTTHSGRSGWSGATAPRSHRHFPRLCRSCDAPMARQEDSCWRCGAVWEYRSAASGEPPLITPTGGALRYAGPQLAAGDDAPADTSEQGQLAPDTDRWINEGGSGPAGQQLKVTEPVGPYDGDG